MKIYFDGGCRPNPGPIVTAVVAGGRTHVHRDHPAGDNSDAEWLALLDALGVARALEASDVILLGDNAHVVGWAQTVLPGGRAGHVPQRFLPYLARFQAEVAGFARVRLRHVRRHHNLAGHALEPAGVWALENRA